MSWHTVRSLRPEGRPPLLPLSLPSDFTLESTFFLLCLGISYLQGFGFPFSLLVHGHDGFDMIQVLFFSFSLAFRRENGVLISFIRFLSGST